MYRYEKVDLAYNFLLEKEKSSESFTINNLAEATGWKPETCRTYPTKRWHQYLSKDGDQYTSSGIVYLSLEEFRAVHSQRLQSTADFSTKGILLSKSREFALLAVSVYNNPFTCFKTYGFIVNIIIAYTALFHAIFEKKGIKYSYLNTDNQPIIIDGEEKAWELSECINQYWPGGNNPQKANIRFLVGLRNKIEHRSLPAIDLAVSGECQSALNNFETLLVEEFGDQHALLTSLAISMQLTRISEDSQIEALKQIQKENYKVVREFMETYRNDLSDEIIESQKYRIRAFLIPKIGNHAKSSDLAIDFINVDKLTDDELANYEQGVAFIKGLENPYKLKPSKVVELVAKSINGFNMPLHTRCWKYFSARPQDIQINYKDTYASYMEGFDGYLYSMNWVNFLIAQLKIDGRINEIRTHPTG